VGGRFAFWGGELKCFIERDLCGAGEPVELVVPWAPRLRIEP
jgi:hypothetical protein